MPNLIRSGSCVVTFLVAALTSIGSNAASTDPYLQAINAEGKRLEIHGKARAEQEQLLRLEAAEHNDGARAARAEPAGTAASSVTQADFEILLRKRFPHNYVLYDLMTPDEKRQVFAEYQKKNVEGTARFIPAVMKIVAISNASSANRIRVQKQTFE